MKPNPTPIPPCVPCAWLMLVAGMILKLNRKNNMSETLKRPELLNGEKRKIINHFVLAMVGKRYCLEHIAECLTLLVPALDPEALAARTEE